MMFESPAGQEAARVYLLALTVDELVEVIDSLDPGPLRDLVQRRLDRIEGRLSDLQTAV